MRYYPYKLKYMEKDYEGIAVLVGIAVVLILLWQMRPRFPKEKPKEEGDQSLRVDDEKEFIPFMCQYAEKHKVKRDDPEQVTRFFYREFENMKFSFVMSSKNILALRKIPEVIDEAIKKYTAQTP